MSRMAYGATEPGLVERLTGGSSAALLGNAIQRTFHLAIGVPPRATAKVTS